MFFSPLFPLRTVPFVAGLILLSQAIITPSAKANVYATNVRLNGATTNLTVASGVGFAISYILNEPATAGVTIQILNSNTPLRTLVITNGPGTLAGTNLVAWDGKDQSGQNPAGGNYSVAVTAASSGYTDWTQISSDANEGNYVWEPRGIGVNRNSSSLYYGRV